MTPFGLAFEYLDKYEGSQIFVFSEGWSAVDSVVDIIFIMEIFVSFNTSYFDEDTHEYVTNRRQISCNYIKGWFWIDFLAILPRFMR